MSAAASSSPPSAVIFHYSCIKRSARLLRGTWNFEVHFNPKKEVRPQFDSKFWEGGFASKEIAELHQEAARRSVEKGGEDYLELNVRKEAYKQDPKLVAALAALERAAGEAAVAAANGEAEAGEANKGNEGVDPPRLPRLLRQRSALTQRYLTQRYLTLTLTLQTTDLSPLPFPLNAYFSIEDI
jgi:hypothetical protein